MPPTVAVTAPPNAAAAQNATVPAQPNAAVADEDGEVQNLFLNKNFSDITIVGYAGPGPVTPPRPPARRGNRRNNAAGDLKF